MSGILTEHERRRSQMTKNFRIAANIVPDAMTFGELRTIVDPETCGAKNLFVIEGEFRPGTGHGFHRHPEQEELMYVISGQVEQWLDRERRMLGPGDAIFVPAGVVHGSYNTGEVEARVLAIFGPSIGTGFTVEDLADQAPWNTLRGEPALTA
jgi:quercetin dioxygenase-like cupin family protein